MFTIRSFKTQFLRSNKLTLISNANLLNIINFRKDLFFFKITYGKIGFILAFYYLVFSFWERVWRVNIFLDESQSLNENRIKFQWNICKNLILLIFIRNKNCYTTPQSSPYSYCRHGTTASAACTASEFDPDVYGEPIGNRPTYCYVLY